MFLMIRLCRVTLIGKRAVLKTVVAVKGDGSSSLSPCVSKLSIDNFKRSRRTPYVSYVILCSLSCTKHEALA